MAKRFDQISCIVLGNGGPALRLELVRGRALRLFLVLKKYSKLLRKLLLGKMYIREVAAFPSWERLPLGKLSFGKICIWKMCIWDIVIWENVYLGNCLLGK